MPSGISGIISDRRKLVKMDKSLKYFLIILVAGFILGWFIKPDKTRQIIEKGRDTLIVHDTTRLPGKPIYISRNNEVSAQKDSATKEITYADSIQGENEQGSYKVTHLVKVNPDSLDKARSDWNVEIKPVEKIVTKKITETVYKDVIQEVATPYYRNIWFYVSSVFALIMILAGLR